MLGGGGDNANVAMIAALLDVRDMEGVVGRVRLVDNGMTLEVSLAYKPAHKAFLYDLIRTPPMSGAAFAAVPQQAVAMAGVALQPPGAVSDPSAGTSARAEILRHVTGLDLGRELFSNIQEIVVFVGPPGESLPNAELGTSLKMLLVRSVGLVIVSRDPAQTRALLDRMLSLPATFSGESTTQPSQEPNEYKLLASNQGSITAYLGQEGHTTVLALNRKVRDAAMEALRTGRNVRTGGPFTKAISEGQDRSKVILVSVGGVLRWVDTMQSPQPAQPTSAPASQPAPSPLAQLAVACADTTALLETVEQDNTFTIRCEVTGIPPLSQVFPLIMQYMQEQQAKARTAKAAMRAPTRRKMLTPTSIRFANAMARRDERTLKELTVPGSPAEAKLAAILERTNLPEFSMTAAKRVGDMGMSLGLPAYTDEVALLLRLQLMDGQKEDVWRVVDVDLLPPAEAKERLEKFAASAPPEEVPLQERNQWLRGAGSDFLAALQKNDEAAIRKLLVPNSPAEAKIKGLLATPDLPMFRFQEMGRRGDFGWVLVYNGIDREDPSAGSLLIHLRKQSSGPPWLVTDVDSLPIAQAQDRLPKLVRRASPSARPSDQPAIQPTTPVENAVHATAEAPRVVATSPSAFTTDVDPSTDKISVTFNRPMMDGSWSWTGGGETFPHRTGEIFYDASRTTCTMPMKLQPGKVYWVGINSPDFNNFRTPEGVPAQRYVILFATRSSDGQPTPLPADLLDQAKAINARSPQSAMPVKRYVVDKPVSAFKAGDFSTPESAAAAFNKALADMNPEEMLKLSWIKWDTQAERQRWDAEKARDPEGLAIYTEALKDSRIVEVSVYRDELANVVSLLPFPPGKGRNPYSSRTMGLIHGQWKNLGEDRLPTVEEARAEFDSKKDNAWKQFTEIHKDVTATQPAGPISDLDRREAENLSAAAWKSWSQQKYDEAEATFQQALAKDPTRADAWNGLGWSQFNQGKPANAKASFERCLSLNPKHAGSLNGMGWVMKNWGKTQEAMEYWKKAVKASPATTAALSGLATTCMELKQYDKALEYYQAWLKAEPNSADAKTGLVKAQQAAKAVKDAVPAAEQWLKLVDAGKYGESWQTGSDSMKAAVTQQQWVDKVKPVRPPLGGVSSRKLQSGEFATTLPGAPDGLYITLTYETTFEKKKQSVETVILEKGKDGSWRVAGYWIK